MKNKKSVLVCALATASILVVGCQPETIDKTYTVTYPTDMETYDYLATYHAADSEILVNAIDGLVEYDVYGILRPSLAKDWTISEDLTKYTFNLRDANWVDNEGNVYGKVTADDFVAGMQHLLDAEGGLEYLLWGVIKNAQAYSDGILTDFSKVGVRAVDADTVEYELESGIPYFMTYLTYNPFLPLNRSFFESKGGVFGKAAYALAKEAGSISFGLVGEQSSILYNGAYIITGYASQSLISLDKNKEYWDVANVKLDKIRYIYDDGKNPTQTYESFKSGTYAAIGINNAVLETAKKDFADNLYVTETTSTTFFAAWNLNRKKYEVGAAVSTKTPDQQADTKVAILNKDFRKAVQFAWDRATWNAQVVGPELQETRLRSLLTPPEFVSLPKAEGAYQSGVFYGDIVEAEYKKMNTGFTGTFKDGKEGVYNETLAKQYRDAAKTALTDEVTFPIVIDIVYEGTSTVATNQANSFKANIEEVLGDDFIQVNLMGAPRPDYLKSGYRAATGADANYDLFWGSGWGPDYGDPLTYLSIFGYGADMMTVIGIVDDQPASAENEDHDDYDIYHVVLGEYDAKLEDAAAELDISKRYIKFAELEAYLLDSAVIIPNQTQGGNYAVTRVIPRNIPYTLFGTDNEKLKHLQIADHVLTKQEILDYRATWAVKRAEALAEAAE